MTVKNFAKYHAEMYGKMPAWSEAWFKTFTDAMFDMLIQEDVTQIHLPHIGTLYKSYLYPKKMYNVSTRRYEDVPGRMTIALTPSALLRDKVRQLPPNPDLAKAEKKRRRQDSMPQKRAPEDIGDDITDEVSDDD